MSRVGNLLGHKVSSCVSEELVSSSRVGVEVELEEVGLMSWDLSYWNTVAEGSLQRNGIEFVFKKPTWGQDVVNALEELETAVSGLADTHTLVDENTSVHVHVDCRDLTTEQLHSFIVTAVLVEQVLVSYAAPERENNIFCLSLTRAEAELPPTKQLLSNLKDNPHGLRHSLENSSKYAGINLSALRSYGSIEFRVHRGEWRKIELLRWINILLSIKEAAILGVINKDNYYEAVFNTPPQAVLQSIFGESLTPYLLNDNVGRQLTTGAKLINELLEMPNTMATPLHTLQEDSLFNKYLQENAITTQYGGEETIPDPSIDDLLRVMRGRMGSPVILDDIVNVEGGT